MSNTDEKAQLKAFGKRLAEVRKKRGLTQQQLAAKLDVSLVSIGYLEIGNRWPRLATLHRICEVLKVSLSELFKGL